jgi:geranylgeranyl diphosphate synthase type II
MLVKAYEYLNETDSKYSRSLIRLLNKTGREVCEGQQLDMDFEKSTIISLEQYLKMIELKTAVLLAGSLQMGAVVAGAGEEDQQNIYEFGKNLGLAFQVQDDWLDSFGNPSTFGKLRGGDILANKKTYLLLYALENSRAAEKRAIMELLQSGGPNKVERMIGIFLDAGVDLAAQVAKRKYMEKAYSHLENISLAPDRKTSLSELADYLLERDI